MEFDPKRLAYMSVGFVDYLREKFEELSDEFVARGEEKSEDLREFLDDIVESIPFLRPRGEYIPGDEREASGNGGRFLDIMDNLGIGPAMRDLLKSLGLAKDEAIKGDDMQAEAADEPSAD